MLAGVGLNLTLHSSAHLLQKQVEGRGRKKDLENKQWICYLMVGELYCFNDKVVFFLMRSNELEV